VLADDERLLALVRDLDVQPIFLDSPVRNGSERIAAALAQGLLGEPSTLLNVQGDAVGVTPAAIHAAAAALARSDHATLGTVAVPGLPGTGRTTVSVEAGHALAFSRRELGPPGALLHHIGVYAYVPAALLRVCALAPGPLEVAESLEQLRWLEHGESVAVDILDAPSQLAHAVDVATDLDG